MKQIKIQVFLHSGVSISKERASRMPDILDYIPGTTLRGALAALYLRHYEIDDLFQGFLNGKNSFPDLLPSKTRESRILPDTAMSCKQAPGFLESKGHGVYDLLFFYAATELLRKNKNRTLSKEQNRKYFHCPRASCQERLKKYAGYIDSNQKVLPTSAFQMHVGIDRRTGTAMPSILYGIQSLQPTKKGQDEEETTDPHYFSGIAFLEESFFQRLQELQEKDSTLFIGKAKTRGYGETSWHLEEVENHLDNRFLLNISDPEQKYTALLNAKNLLDGVAPCLSEKGYFLSHDFEVEILELDKKWMIQDREGEPRYFIERNQNTLEVYGSFLALLETWDMNFRRFCVQPPFDLSLPKENFYFAILLNSHTIVVDRWLRYSARPEDFIAALGISNISSIFTQAMLIPIQGWNAKHALPKEEEFGIQRGSVYLLATQDKDTTISYLKRLASQGIGLRREEGFGRIVISDPFHWQYILK